jgi:DNA mismatch repair protein MutS2
VKRLDARAELESHINESFDEQGRLVDTASAELQTLRIQLRQAVAEVNRIMKQQLQSEDARTVLQEALITERSGRQVMPVKQTHQAIFPGIVHDVSASGATVYMEPLAAVAANNRVRELEASERHEIDRILSELSSEVGASCEAIVDGVEKLGTIDGILACARYADAHKTVEPTISPGAGFQLRGARHPLLGETVVPIDIEIPAGGAQAIVITGPNTGGKTVALKTVGLLHLMAACGLHVPAASARLAVYDQVLADIGDEQSIEQSLSTFASHLQILIAMLRAAGPRTLVLADELGAGTDPTEGAALGQAILERWLEAGASIVVTTHHPELKLFAHHHAQARNASVEFDAATLQPTYRLVMDLPGRSNAFDIATGLGLDAEIVDSARAKLDTDFRDVDGLIGALQHDRAKLSTIQTEVAEEASRLADARRVVDKRLEGLEVERQQVLGEARREARGLLRQARTALQQAKHAVREDSGGLANAIRSRVRRLEDRLENSTQSADPTRQPEELEIAKGDRVRIDGFSREGLVTAVDAREAEVAVGAVRTRVPKAQVREVLAPSRPLARRKIRSGEPSPPQEVYVRGRRAIDALEELDASLDQALLQGSPLLRVVHGKGTGALRRAIRERANEHPCVIDMTDAEPEAGGSGVTVLTLGGNRG